MESIGTERGIAAFLNYTTPDLVRALRESVFYDLNYELKRRVPLPAQKGTEITAVQILEYLHQCRRTLEAYILERNSGYPSLRWMYYSRRIPNYALLEPEGRLDLYRLHLFDAITGQITTEYSAGVDLVNCPLHESVLKRALRFSQEIYFLANFHTYLHQAGKGVSFTFGEWAFPTPRVTSVISKSFSLFDWRIALFNQIPLTGLGTRAHGTPSEDHLERTFATVGRLAETTLIKVPESMSPEKLAIWANYSVQAYDFRKLGDLIADGRIASLLWSQEAGPLLMLMRMAYELILVPAILTTILQVGYVVSTEQSLIEGFSLIYKSAEESVRTTAPGLDIPGGPEELFQTLAGMRSSLWPLLPGPVIRGCGDTVYLDLASATVRLNHAFQFPRGSGIEANVRAEHFEDSVQEAVDSSRWSSTAVRGMKGRTLRYNGNSITDIDAIGARDRKLLLISCKSVLYAEYDEANYKIMHNAAELVKTSVIRWAHICEFLKEKPIGDNYDFSQYEEVIGVVCTPILVYAPLGITTDEVADGLYAAVSLSELKTWLDGKSLTRKQFLS
jgi:hypothetical protein